MKKTNNIKKIKENAFKHGFIVSKNKELEFQEFLFDFTFKRFRDELKDKFTIFDIFSEKSSQIFEIYRKYYKTSGEKTMTLYFEKGIECLDIRDSFIENNFQEIKQKGLEEGFLNEDLVFSEKEVLLMNEAYFISLIFHLYKLSKELYKKALKTKDRRESNIYSIKADYLTALISLYIYKDYSKYFQYYGSGSKLSLSFSSTKAANEIRGYMKFINKVLKKDKEEMQEKILKVAEEQISVKKNFALLEPREVLNFSNMS